MTTPTAVAPLALVQGATRTALPFGLFSTFTFRGNGDRWESGVTWETTTCEPAGGIGQWVCPPDQVTGLPKDLDDNAGENGVATPFTVYGHYACLGPASWDDAQDLANQHLLGREEQRVEQALWTGDLGNVPYLADEDETTVLAGGTAMGPASALAILEDHIAGNYGGLGVIHMTRGAALTLASADVLESIGGRLQTKVGTPVAAGSGYAGTGPDGTDPGAGQSWAYVTPPLFGYRSDVFTSSARQGDLLNRGTNQLTAIAERNYLLGYDPCGVAAVKLDLATP